jgi:serine/threonine protein kinase
MAKNAASEQLPDQPESVGRYQIVEPLGRGAMGTVYRARDTVLDREVAVKIMAGGLQQDTAFRTRFEREARIVARINHPNVVVVYDLGYHTDGSPFIAMELLSGQDLATVLRTRPLDADDSAAVALQVLAGLARAHQREIVHRDVKPANIFVTEDGKVKVMDFGVARLTASAVTATGAVLGTAYYMSPEQVRGGRVDGRSDVFSVGCVLFEMLASRRPFQADDMLGILYQIANAEPDFSLVPPPGQTLVPILQRALQKDPALRYASAPEFARDLRRYLRQKASSPWARQAAEIVELEPGSGSGPVLGARPGTDGEPPTEVTKAGSTVSPLGHLVGGPLTDVSEGSPARPSTARADEHSSPAARLPVRTIGVVGGAPQRGVVPIRLRDHPQLADQPAHRDSGRGACGDRPLGDGCGRTGGAHPGHDRGHRLLADCGGRAAAERRPLLGALRHREQGLDERAEPLLADATGLRRVPHPLERARSAGGRGDELLEERRRQLRALVRQRAFPGLGERLDLGFSFARNRLREPGESELERPLDDPRHYGALIRAQGLDANLRLADATVRSYLIWSSEDLSATPPDPNPEDLRHRGFLLEGVYLFQLERPVLSVGALAPKVRFDYAEIESLHDAGARVERDKGYTVSLGVNIYPSSEIVGSGTYPYRNFFISLEYHVLRESTGPWLDNDRFVARITGRF